MTNNDMAIPMSSLSERLVLKVRLTGVHRFEMRCWLASKLFALGGAVAGCDVEVDVHTKPDDMT